MNCGIQDGYHVFFQRLKSLNHPIQSNKQYCSVSFIEMVTFQGFIQTQKLEPLTNGIVTVPLESTVEQLSFELTLQYVIGKLKCQNHLVQHNEQYHKKVLLTEKITPKGFICRNTLYIITNSTTEKCCPAAYYLVHSSILSATADPVVRTTFDVRIQLPVSVKEPQPSQYEMP